MTSMSRIGGTKSSPIPSTSHEPGFTVRPSFTSGVSTDPSGSARMSSMSGLRCRRYRPRPAIVPPEPTPATRASSRPSICCQISGPVVVSCASGLAGLPNWLMKRLLGVSRAMRAAMSW